MARSLELNMLQALGALSDAVAVMEKNPGSKDNPQLHAMMAAVLDVGLKQVLAVYRAAPVGEQRNRLERWIAAAEEMQGQFRAKSAAWVERPPEVPQEANANDEWDD